MHFEITICKIFLGKGCSLQHLNIIFLYTFRPKYGLKFAFSTHQSYNFLTQGGALPLQPPNQHPLTNQNYLRARNNIFSLTMYKLSYTRGRCLGPLSRALLLDPTRGPIDGPGSNSWVLSLCARCFALQAIPKSWKPCMYHYWLLFS